MTAPERRKTIRFRTAAISVRSDDTRMPLALVDLGLGGFSTQSAGPLPVGATMQFRFATLDGKWATTLAARSVYSRPGAQAPSDAAQFLSGFEFLNPETPTVMERINALIDHATAVISFS